MLCAVGYASVEYALHGIEEATLPADIKTYMHIHARGLCFYAGDIRKREISQNASRILSGKLDIYLLAST